MSLLQRLAGSSWTDHNTHDPGITLLEALCYALTDLGYRTDYSLPDLLASSVTGPSDANAATDGGSTAATASTASSGLFTPAQVLPSAPVTLDDLRKLVVDLPGVRNAWIRPLDEALGWHDAALGLLSAMPALPSGGAAAAPGSAPAPAPAPATATAAGSPGNPGSSPNLSSLRPLGLLQVLIDKSGLGEDVDGSTLVRNTAQRLLQWRGLGTDVARITLLDRQLVALDGSIEVQPGHDTTELLAAVYQAVAAHLAPALPFRSLADMLQRGWRVDQIFEGPLLDSGFIDPADWAAAGQCSTVRLSDLIHVLMAVPGVAAVKSLGFVRDGAVSRDWLLVIDPQRSASFDVAGSSFRLERRGLRLDQDSTSATAHQLFAARLRRSARTPQAGGVVRDIPAPVGRNRQVARYLSIAHHLPAAYGVGVGGLSSNAPLARLAWARQLKAYLLVFDQLLANQHALLAGVGQLLSFTDTSSRASFAQAVPDDGGALQLDTVRRRPLAAHQVAVQSLAAMPWNSAGDGSAVLPDDLGDPAGNPSSSAPTGSAASLAQRHRLVDHLLARLGEHWDQHSPAADGPPAAQPAAGEGESTGADAVTSTDAGTSTEPALQALARSLRDKQAFLRQYPAQALRRGVGLDGLGLPAAGSAGAGDADSVDRADSAGVADGSTGLARRLVQLLGLVAPLETPLLVEHILLRPLPGDRFQQGPLLRGVAARDPFSLQLSLVVPGQGVGGRLALADKRQRIAGALRDELPAHLQARLLWLDTAAMAQFATLHSQWLALWRQANRRQFGVPAGDAAARLAAPGSAAAAATDAAANPGTDPDTDHQIPLRSARNRLIDALGLADTCPLTDLRVADGSPNGPIKVAFGQTARIAVDNSEPGTRYTLLGPDGQPVPGALDGTGGRLLLETAAITDDSHFRVQASKLVTPAGRPAQPPVLLAQGVAVKVGLDTRLGLALPGLPLLDAGLSNPQPGDARLVPFGARVQVQVLLSQEGVAYALALNGQLQPEQVIGDLATITLLSPPLADDSQITVQATKTFTGGGGGAGTGGAAEQQWLDARLQVAVRANPGLRLQVLPGAVLDSPSGTARLQVADSQVGVRYSLYCRRVRDAEWLRDLSAGPAPDTPVLRAQGGVVPAGLPAVPLPQRPDDASLPDGFDPLPGAPLAGNGVALDLPLGAPLDDAVYLVQASKQHAAAGNGPAIRTDVGLLQAVLVLLRPDTRGDPATTPRVALLLPVPPANGQPAPAAQLQVSGGQPGVFYGFKVDPDGPPTALAAYVHQRDGLAAGSNKGVGQLAVGIDLAVARDVDPSTEPPADPATARSLQTPRPPRLLLPTLPNADAANGVDGATVLLVQAVKAQTGLDATLPGRLLLPALPPVAAVSPAFVAPGASASVLLDNSLVTDLHQLQRAGQALADPVAGSGAALTLDTGAVLEDGTVELVINPGAADQADPAHLPLQRRLALRLRLLPRNDLALSAARDSLAVGEGTDILVANSQPGVAYQLLINGQAAGQPLPGTGTVAALALATGALAGPAGTEAGVSVLASRVDDASASVLLVAALRIAVRAAGG